MTHECQYIHKICLFIMQDITRDTDIAVTVQSLSSAALCVCSDGMCII